MSTNDTHAHACQICGEKKPSQLRRPIVVRPVVSKIIPEKPATGMKTAEYA